LLVQENDLKNARMWLMYAVCDWAMWHLGQHERYVISMGVWLVHLNRQDLAVITWYWLPQCDLWRYGTGCIVY